MDGEGGTEAEGPMGQRWGGFQGQGYPGGRSRGAETVLKQRLWGATKASIKMGGWQCDAAGGGGSPLV